MKDYIGDGVYASDELNPGSITLTTGTHVEAEADNIIHLDPQVITALIGFVARREKEMKDRRFNAIRDRLPEAFKSRASCFMDCLDIDNLTHAETMEVMRALSAGRWERAPNSNGASLDYSTTIDGLKVRLWAAAPPDSCRVVEEEYEIPAVPASTGVRKRVICAKAAKEESPQAAPEEEWDVDQTAHPFPTESSKINDDDLPI